VRSAAQITSWCVQEVCVQEVCVSTPSTRKQTTIVRRVTGTEDVSAEWFKNVSTKPECIKSAFVLQSECISPKNSRKILRF
jgi:hypothetical protein